MVTHFGDVNKRKKICYIPENQDEVVNINNCKTLLPPTFPQLSLTNIRLFNIISMRSRQSKDET